MGEPKILITGATGRTGKEVVEDLLAVEATVRAFVRKDDDRAAHIRSMGAEVAVGDFLNLDDIRAAATGISRAYFCYPTRPGLVEATAFFAQAAREEGLQAIVNMSQKPARSDAKSNASRNHWIAERVFDWSGIPVTHLRPTYFAKWLLLPFNGGTARGEIRLPFGNGRHAPIAVEDLTRVIAKILLDPQPHAGKTYPLYGPVEMNYKEIAAAVGTTLGRPIAYRDIAIDDYRKHLESLFPPYLVQHLCETAIDYQNGVFAGTNDTIEQITGRKPLTVDAFVSAHSDAFAEKPA